MSFWGSVKTFFEKFEQKFVALFKKAPSFEQKAAAVVAYVAPAVQMILGLVDPPLAAILAPIFAVVEKDLAIVETVTTSLVVAPGTSAIVTVENALTAVKTNIAGILQLAEVKSSAKVTQIETEVSGVVGEIEALLADLPSATPAS